MPTNLKRFESIMSPITVVILKAPSWPPSVLAQASYFEHGGQEVLRWILAPMQSWISSAMAMAMSIYRTLCVLVFLKISLLEMLIPFGNIGNEHLTSK